MSPDTLTPVVALATTGLPRKGHVPAIVGIAFTMLRPYAQWPGGTPVLHYIRQDAKVLASAEARQAQAFHGITADVINLRGISEQDACDTLAEWLDRATYVAAQEAQIVGPWRGYNMPFINQIFAGSSLGAEAWSQALGGYHLPGRCIMAEAADVLGSDGLLLRGKNGQYRYPKLADVGRWARRKGHKVPTFAPGVPMGPQNTVRLAAAAALALRAERKAPVIRMPSRGTNNFPSFDAPGEEPPWNG